MKVCANCGSVLSNRFTTSGACSACLLRIGLEPRKLIVSNDEFDAQVLGPVGRGPNGTVFLAARPDEDLQVVTIKVIEASLDVAVFNECMKDTFAALDSLDHPGLPQLVQLGVTPINQPYVVAEYLAGPSLTDFRGEQHGGGQHRPIALHLSSTIADLHRHGIVHGSIKPSNIVISETDDGPFPVLLDTGVTVAIEIARGAGGLPDQASDERSLMRVLGGLSNELRTIVAGKESASQVVEALEGWRI